MKTVYLLLLLVVSSQFALGVTNVESQLEALRAQGAQEGWTFQVGDSPILHQSLAFRTGLKTPENWAELAPFVALKTRTDLPAEWDWREHGGVTKIKNQASCGSCWAFGTVASLESTIKIKTGKELDLAEQQLVSCKPSYGSCGGGYFAFGFYKTVGANYTSDFPYKASNVACKTSAAKHEQIASWAYVGAKDRSPSTDEIKTAIYTYGAVAVTVSASGAFSSYKSGVYNACNSGGTNHIVALVGWSDADQAWILKNSWGESWGDKGYMRIKYTGKSGSKCNSVGQSAAYSVVNPAALAELMN